MHPEGGSLILVLIEIMAWLVTVTLAVLWINDPGGNYEPWTVICGVVAAGAEGYRHLRSRPEKASVRPTAEPEQLIRWIQDHGAEKPLSEVLPRTLHLAQVIDDRDLEHWVRMELYGYTQEGGMTEQDSVPEYREVTGRYVDEHSRMLQIQDERLHFVNSYRFRLGARQLEEIARKEKMQNIRDEDFIELLRQELHVDVFRFCFSPTEIVGVVDRIRNRLLERINRIELKQIRPGDATKILEDLKHKPTRTLLIAFAIVALGIIGTLSYKYLKMVVWDSRNQPSAETPSVKPGSSPAQPSRNVTPDKAGLRRPTYTPAEPAKRSSIKKPFDSDHRPIQALENKSTPSSSVEDLVKLSSLGNWQPQADWKDKVANHHVTVKYTEQNKKHAAIIVKRLRALGAQVDHAMLSKDLSPPGASLEYSSVNEDAATSIKLSLADKVSPIQSHPTTQTIDTMTLSIP